MAKGKGGYGGFGGGMPGNMNNILKQAQKMQKQMEEAQAALDDEVVTATAGGGAIEVTMTGNKVLTSVRIDKEAVDPEDVEMLQDMIVAVVNEALKKVEALSEEKMAKITGGASGLNGLF